MFRAAATLLLAATPLAVSAAHAAAEEPHAPFRTALAAYLLNEMAHEQVPGAVFALVHEGQSDFVWAGGYADLAARIPADAERSLFRIGSISKPIVAVAVLQAAQRGLLDLDRDVNAYLDDLQVPAFPGGPVTLRRLLLHTAGFDEQLLGMGVRSAAQLRPLAAYLADRLPPRVRPAGELVGYSNHGYVLAAAVLEAASDRSFGAWVERHIETPLGMAQGGFDQRVDDPRPIATPYRATPAGPQPDETGRGASQVWPAGAYAVTARDMTRPMTALLEGGPLLDDAGRDALMARAFMHHPELTRGRTLGFQERWYNGYRVLAHSGRVAGFTSLLVLVPEARLGFFLSANGERGDRLRNGTMAIVGEHFLPRRAPQALPPLHPLAPEALARYAGAYRPVRHAERGFEKIAMLGRETLLEPNGMGGLTERRFGSRAPVTSWMPIGEDLFQNLPGDQPRRLAFRFGGGGEVRHAFLEADDFLTNDALERLAWWERSSVHLAALAAACAVLIAAPLRRWSRRRRPEANPAAWRAAGLVAALEAAFLAALAIALLVLRPEQFVFGLPLWLRALRGLLALAALVNLYLTWHVLGAWQRPTYPGGGRIHLCLAASAGWLVLLIAHYWNQF